MDALNACGYLSRVVALPVAVAEAVFDDVDAGIAFVEELGGANTGEVHTGPEWVDVVMTDPEGTEFCLVAPRTS